MSGKTRVSIEIEWLRIRRTTWRRGREFSRPNGPPPIVSETINPPSSSIGTSRLGPTMASRTSTIRTTRIMVPIVACGIHKSAAGRRTRKKYSDTWNTRTVNGMRQPLLIRIAAILEAFRIPRICPSQIVRRPRTVRPSDKHTSRNVNHPWVRQVHHRVRRVRAALVEWRVWVGWREWAVLAAIRAAPRGALQWAGAAAPIRPVEWEWAQMAARPARAQPQVVFTVSWDALATSPDPEVMEQHQTFCNVWRQSSQSSS